MLFLAIGLLFYRNIDNMSVPLLENIHSDEEHLTNIKQITRSGANAFCVASAITKSKNPEKIIYEMKQFTD